MGYPLESLSAGLCIVVVVVAVNMLGERLADRAQARAVTSLLEIEDLTVTLPVEGEQRAGAARRLAARSPPARPSGWSASPGRASR